MAVYKDNEEKNKRRKIFECLKVEENAKIILRKKNEKKKKKSGSTEIWTRIAGFRVQSANHYTIEPVDKTGTHIIIHNTNCPFVVGLFSFKDF